MKKNTTKVLSIILNLTLVGSSFADVAMPGIAAANNMPDFARALVPPSRLGFLDSWYQGQTKNPVVLIQDLHANYGVQKNIYGILNDLQSKIAQGGRPMNIGVEAAWGPIDMSFLQKEDPKVREVVGEFLLKEAEMSGMEHFASMSASPVNLLGIDNPEDYILHRDLFRKSLESRLKLARKVDELRQIVDHSRNIATARIKHLWKIEKAFESGEMDLPELSRALDMPDIKNYGEAEAALYQKKLEAADQSSGEKGFFLKNLVKADQDLALLSRLFRQQLTLEEVQFAASKISEMLVVVKALMPGENLAEWQETIREAIDYYAVALMRDKPLAEHAYDLASKNPDTSVVIVTGGFHTAGIAEILRQKQMSYVVIAPVVASHTSHDEMLYIRRIMGEHLTLDDLANTNVALPSSHALMFQDLPTLAGRTVDKANQAATNVLETIVNLGRGAVAAGAKKIELTRDGQAAPELNLLTVVAYKDMNGTDAAAVKGMLKDIDQGIKYRSVSVGQLTGMEKVFNGEYEAKDRPVLQIVTASGDRMSVFSAQQHGYFKNGDKFVLQAGHNVDDKQVVEVVPAPKPSSYEMTVGENGKITSVSSEGKEIADLMNTVLGFFDSADAAKLKQNLLDRGNGEFTVDFLANKAPEQVIFGDEGDGETHVIFDPALRQAGKENDLTVAAIKAMANLLKEKGETNTYPAFFQAAAQGLKGGIFGLRAAVSDMGLGAQPLLHAVDKIIAQVPGLAGMDNAAQAQAIANNRPTIDNIVRELLAEFDAAYPGFRFEQRGGSEHELHFMTVATTAEPSAAEANTAAAAVMHEIPLTGEGHETGELSGNKVLAEASHAFNTALQDVETVVVEGPKAVRDEIISHQQQEQVKQRRFKALARIKEAIQS